MSLKDEITKISEEIAELAQFAEQAKLPSNKTFLTSEVNRLKTRKANLEKELEQGQAAAASPAASLGVSPAHSGDLGIILVNNYMWDQTNEYVKIYIEVDKGQKIEDNQLLLKFSSKNNFTCIFGKYRFTLGRLYRDLNTEKSSVKVTKSNRVIITLYKAVSENWPSLNVQESKFKDALGGDDNEIEADPNAGMMKLMKSMYDEGDDEMKRTIAKTFYESQTKKGAAEFDSSQLQL